ncbi:MAG: metal ABC transporter substrate-binding protein [Bacillota bacterium]|nr:metal ABC transporter substrate-binding protein [Bacillota bacterium]
MKRILLILLAFSILFSFSSCQNASYTDINNKKLKIITTVFPAYDFARQIAMDKADVSLLLKPGADPHTFDPTPSDIMKIQNCNIFIYVGGESEDWVKSILKSIDTSKIEVIRLFDYVSLKQEPILPEMKTNDTHQTAETDEHIWTSPQNAILLTKAISKSIIKADTNSRSFYQLSTDNYLNKLTNLDNTFRKIVEQSKRKEIIFGDRFPLKYFIDEYGLSFSAAFPGCSSETEPSAQKVCFLIDKVKKDKIPVVFYVEFSNHYIADTISDETGATPLLFHSCHNITKDEFKQNATYIGLMTQNAKNLKIALN